MKHTVYYPTHFEQELVMILGECEHDKIFILTDTNTTRYCLPKIASFRCLQHAVPIEIEAGDTHKDIASLTAVWKVLSDQGATRHSLLICLGGGMITDLGGFAAATFKRGMSFIHIPTTLLAMVDASVGGKTGINFNQLKNEIGAFAPAQAVIIAPEFLTTLDTENLYSGMAEMLKHALLSGVEAWQEMMTLEPENVTSGNWKMLLKRSLNLKQHVVEEDPLERGLRKALNLGHTVGHALEIWSHEQAKPLLHGYAVAYGLVVELYLSVVLCGFPLQRLRQTADFIHRHYGKLLFTCDDYDFLIEKMRHDKKNMETNRINCTLLKDVGDVKINVGIEEELMKEALDFYREGL